MRSTNRNNLLNYLGKHVRKKFFKRTCQSLPPGTSGLQRKDNKGQWKYNGKVHLPSRTHIAFLQFSAVSNPCITNPDFRYIDIVHLVVFIQFSNPYVIVSSLGDFVETYFLVHCCNQFCCNLFSQCCIKQHDHFLQPCVLSLSQ